VRFLLDESADYPLVHFLRSLGHDVTAVAHDYPGALKDQEVLEIAVRESRIVIANDKDFGELVVRRRLRHAGVILFRLDDEELPIKVAWLEYVLEHHADHLDRMIVVTESGVRIRTVGIAP
jgi:predicted nuclease of predicted toxin-antitoxin system